MKFKRTMAMVMATAMMLGLAACGGGSSSGGGSSAGGDDEVKIAYIVKAKSDAFWTSMEDGAESFAEEKGIHLEFQAPEKETDVEKQVQMVENAVIKGFDAIVLSAADSNSLAPAIKKANDANIPVILVNDTMSQAALDEAGAHVETYVGIDQYEAASLAGKYAAENIKDAKILYLEGIAGVDALTQRLEGFKDQCGSFKVVASQTAKCDRNEAFNVMQNVLSSNPEVNVVWAVNAEMGQGAIQAIEQGGFSAPFSTALMATSSSIAIVIPPSIAFVVYASITGVSIADMFMAGIVPGLLMGVALVIIVMIEAKKHNIQPSREKASAKARWDTFKDAFWGFLMPVIILGGIYGGIFTPTEAAAVSVVYGLFVGMVIYREVKLKDLFDILVDSAKTTGGIMLIVASASLFSFVCTKFGIANAASELLAGIAHNQFTFLLIVNIIFLIAGCFIDANSAMYIFVPIMLPVCKALGYDVVAFGVMATVNLAIGQVTPPVGVNLFVAISIKIKKGLEVTLQQISRAVMPMIAASVDFE